MILRRGRLFLAGDNGTGQLGRAQKDLEWASTFQELPFLDYTLRVRAVALGRRVHFFFTVALTLIRDVHIDIPLELQATQDGRY